MTTSNYPASFDVFDKPGSTDKVNIGQSHSNSHKHLANALEAIQATLGTNPHAGFSTVAEKLAYLYGLISYDPSGFTPAQVANLLAGISSGDRSSLSQAIYNDLESTLTSQFAPLASPTFTGNVVVPDADADNEALNVRTAHSFLTQRASLDFSNGVLFSTPDHAKFTPTQSIDLRAIARRSDWTPSSDKCLVSHYSTSDNQRSWSLTLNGQTIPGRPCMFLSSNGTSPVTIFASSNPPVQDGDFLALRSIWVASPTPKVSFYWASPGVDIERDDVWTLLSEGTVSVPATLFNSNAPVAIGRMFNTQHWDGDITKVVVKVDGATVASVDLTRPFFGAITDGYSNTWTMTGSPVWRDSYGNKIRAPLSASSGVVWINEFTAIGSGSPEGVVTAPVGSKYRDRAATNGAVEWVKASGSGNTGWRVVYGDTGWRTLVSWDSSGNYTYNDLGNLGSDFAPRTGFAGRIHIRRLDNWVLWNVSNLQTASALSDSSEYAITAFGTPTGFRPANGNSHYPAVTARRLLGTVRTVTSGGALTFAPAEAIPLGAVVIPAIAQHIGPVLTVDDWPTSLPGVAA